VTRESPHPDLQGVGAMYQTKPLQDGTKSMSERHRAAWIGAAVMAAGLTLAGWRGERLGPSSGGYGRKRCPYLGLREGQHRSMSGVWPEKRIDGLWVGSVQRSQQREVYIRQLNQDQ